MFIWSIGNFGLFRARLHGILQCFFLYFKGDKIERVGSYCQCRAYSILEANRFSSGSNPMTRTSLHGLQGSDCPNKWPGQPLTYCLTFLVCCAKMHVSLVCKGLRLHWCYVVLWYCPVRPTIWIYFGFWYIFLVLHYSCKVPWLLLEKRVHLQLEVINKLLTEQKWKHSAPSAA